jgi:hypothetical protein
MAWRSFLETEKWAPDSMTSPSFDQVILGFGLPVNGILTTTFSPLSKKAVSRKRGGMLNFGGAAFQKIVTITIVTSSLRHNFFIHRIKRDCPLLTI